MRAGLTKRLIVPAVALVALIAAACTSAGGSDQIVGSSQSTASEAPPGSAAVAPDTQPETLFTSVNPPATGSGAASAAPQAWPGDLDPDLIVAAEEKVLSDLYERVLPSTVQITVTHLVGDDRGSDSPFPIPFDPTPGGDDFFRDGDGSGFVWDDEGHIITNHHVVTGAERVKVTFPDGTETDAEVLGTDPDSDLAVLKVVLPREFLRPVEVGDSDSLKVGQMAVAIGTPFGAEFTMTRGMISALGRRINSPRQSYSIPDAIQTDASINPGNSGGPLLDRKGRVIGINSQIITRTGVNTGIGFAIPVNEAKRVVPAIIRDGVYEHAWLGVQVDSVDGDLAEILRLPPNTRGALITSVIEGGPADQAGLRGWDSRLTRKGRTYEIGGDVITALNGEPVKSIDDLIGYLSARTRPGDGVTVDVIRDGETIAIEVTLAARPVAG